MQLYMTIRDDVIRSSVSLGTVSYGYALEQLYPLLNRFGEQRKIQSKKFYQRLRSDILKGCVVPPITVAIVSKQMCDSVDVAEIKRFAEENIEQAYILDGLQRLNTLNDAATTGLLDMDKSLPLSFIVAEKYDFLLYRMITLNNGQKPMTARHQIEMLTSGLVETERSNIQIVSEKETESARFVGAFRRSDISEAYIAFMSDSLHNQNARIIESKLDEILVGKVMESNIFEAEVSFSDILDEVNRLSTNEGVKSWLRLGNNLIGFAVGAKQSLPCLKSVDPDKFFDLTRMFEDTFRSLETSKVNVGKVRREFALKFISEIAAFQDFDEERFVEEFIELTM